MNSTWIGQIRSGEGTSASLIKLMKDDAAEGWQCFHQVYGPLVYYWCRQAGIREQDAADIVQDVFRSIYMNMTRFQRVKEFGFRAWIKAITRNKVRDFFRSDSKSPQVIGGSSFMDRVQDIESPAAQEWDEHEDESAFIHHVLQLLQTEFEHTTWRAFWMTTVESRHTQHVATDLQISHGAVRQAKYRVLRRLRQAIDELR